MPPVEGDAMLRPVYLLQRGGKRPRRTRMTPLEREAVTRLETLEEPDVTEWEMEFLQALRCWQGALTPKQQAVLRRMVEKYLGPTLAAELAGQQRLW